MLPLLLIAAVLAAPDDRYSTSLIPTAAAPSQQVAIDADPFSWVEPVAVEIPAGGTGTISFRLVVPAGTHIYRDAIEVEVVDAGGLIVGATDLPAAMKIPDPGGTGEIRELYDRDVYVQIPVSAPKTVTGLVQVHLVAHHQGCRPGLCFPPKATEMIALVRIKAP